MTHALLFGHGIVIRLWSCLPDGHDYLWRERHNTKRRINPRTCCSASPSNHLYSAEVNGQPHTHRTYSDGTVELESW